MANAFDEAKRKAREADILEIAARHGLLSELKKAGAEYNGACPKCGRGPGRSNRFSINPKKNSKSGSRGMFACRRCGIGGDAIALEQLLSGTNFRDTIEKLNGAKIVEPDPGEAERKARFWAFMRKTVDKTVLGLVPVLDSPGADYLRTRAVDTSLPIVRRALETTAAIGWNPAVYYSQKDPSEPFHDLHGRYLGCIVGIMTDPVTGERLGPISRTYVHRGKKVGKAKTLKRAEDERLGVVRVSVAEDLRRLACAEGLETTLAVLEMGGVPTWSTGCDFIMRNFPIVEGVELLLIMADNDATEDGERGPGERAGRACRVRWLGAGRKAEFLMPPDFKTDFNDVLMQRKGFAR